MLQGATDAAPPLPTTPAAPRRRAPIVARGRAAAPPPEETTRTTPRTLARVPLPTGPAVQRPVSRQPNSERYRRYAGNRVGQHSTSWLQQPVDTHDPMAPCHPGLCTPHRHRPQTPTWPQQRTVATGRRRPRSCAPRCSGAPAAAPYPGPPHPPPPAAPLPAGEQQPARA
jgi:hypothetical protein